jgi:redox-sensitive bicupin YhaK (pirin superfamily)
VNLPAKHKGAPPRYQALLADEIGLVPLPDGAGLVRVVAGELDGQSGPAKTFSPMNVFDVRLNAGRRFEMTIPARWNAGLLVMKGDVVLQGGVPATLHDFVVLGNTGDHVVIEARSEAHLLALSGEPIGEPIVQYGPFVMNTAQEIEQAFDDLRRGKFGQLQD